MLKFPKKRVYGLLGAPRSGKDAVAQYLKETRGFEVFAFGDQIKEEFGISIEDFESAKISGDIEKVRNEIWAFSEQVRAKDPMHFINRIVEKIKASRNSAVVTDIRTKDELNAIYDFVLECSMYFVDAGEPYKKDGLLIQSKLKMESINVGRRLGRIKTIKNDKHGLYYFYQYLDRFFMNEDIGHLISNRDAREEMIRYLEQFNINQKN